MLGTLVGHTDRVNCVRWLPPGALPHNQPAVLASGASDGSVRIWQWTPGTPGQPWRLAAVLQAHTAPVTSLAVLALPAGGLLLVSTAGDGEAAVWESSPTGPNSSSGAGSATSAGAAAAGPPEQDSWRLRQRIPLGHRLPGCAALAPLPSDPGWLLLALGGVDSTVRLFLCPPDEGGQFEPVCQLAGHQDWVKGLAFAQMDGETGAGPPGCAPCNIVWVPGSLRAWAGHLALCHPTGALVTRPAVPCPTSRAGRRDFRALLSPSRPLDRPAGGKLLLASASQDKNVRVWAVQLQQPGDQPPGSGAAAAPAGAALLTRYAPKPLLRTDRHEYSATLEALLVGHEDWVHAVAWHPRVPCSGAGGGGTSQPACLLSASMDRTMMVWRPDPATGEAPHRGSAPPC